MYIWVASQVTKGLQTWDLGNQGISGKSQNFIEWEPYAQSSCQNKIVANTIKKRLKNRN